MVINQPKIKEPALGGSNITANRSTRQDLGLKFDPREDCEAKGGIWTGTACLLPGTPEYQAAKSKEAVNRETGLNVNNIQPPQQKNQEVKGAYDPNRKGFVAENGAFYPTNNPDFKPNANPDKKIEFGNGNVTITGGDGKPVTLTKEEYEVYLGNKAGNITPAIQQAQAIPTRSQFEAQQLSQEVGQFNPLSTQESNILGGASIGEAFTTGLINNIPKAASYAVAAGIATGAGSNPVSWGAAGAVFAGTLAGGIVSDLKGQRRDITQAQKRVLDEGKQTLKDWATMAEIDPANKAYYLAQYNQVAAQIDQAYRQIKLDTSRDLGKFETALPDLAEFEAFYSTGGERDLLNLEMQQALLAQTSSEYKALELAQRRAQVDGSTN